MTTYTEGPSCECGLATNAFDYRISLEFVLPAEVSHCINNLAVLTLQSFTHAYKHCYDICDSLLDLLCKRNASSKMLSPPIQTLRLWP